MEIHGCQNMSLTIQLPKFEGPMALLLYLIRKDEMDIFDMSTVIGGNGKTCFVGAEHIDIVYTDILDIIGCFRSYLEEVTISVADHISNCVIPGRPGKSE